MLVFPGRGTTGCPESPGHAADAVAVQLGAATDHNIVAPLHTAKAFTYLLKQR